MGGCGMVDPNVLEMAGIDPNEYSGFAAGFGVERFAMVIHDINDIREFYKNDNRFLEQFPHFHDEGLVTMMAGGDNGEAPIAPRSTLPAVGDVAPTQLSAPAAAEPKKEEKKQKKKKKKKSAEPAVAADIDVSKLDTNV